MFAVNLEAFLKVPIHRNERGDMFYAVVGEIRCNEPAIGVEAL